MGSKLSFPEILATQVSVPNFRRKVWGFHQHHNSRLHPIIFLALFILFFSPGICRAGVGARALGMGGAMVAVADDPSASYWNPAGLSLKPLNEIYFSSALNNRESFFHDDYLTGTWAWEGYSASENDSPIMEQVIKIGGVLLVYETLKSTFKKKDDTKPQTEEDSNLEDVNPRPQPPEPRPHPVPPPPYPWYWWGWDPYSYHWGHHRPRHHEKEIIEKAAATPAEIPPTARYYVQALGFSYLRDRTILPNSNSHYSDWFIFSLAHRWRQSPWSWGLNFKFMNERLLTSRGAAAAAALEADFGILWRALPDLNVGLNIQDFLNTNFGFDPENQIEYSTSFRLGVAYLPDPATTLAMELDNIFRAGGLPLTLHLGIERELWPDIKIRGGLYDGKPTLGLGFKLFNIQWDYAYFADPDKASHIFGAGIFF